jgi:hypothetical protein
VPEVARNLVGIVARLTPRYDVPWNLALEALSQAEEIRIVGYSLPEGDSYVRYLLKAAAIRNDDLRRVGVICWDPENVGRVQERYENFVSEGYLAFRNARCGAYFANVSERVRNQQQGSPSYFLEATHAYFFGRTIAPPSP